MPSLSNNATCYCYVQMLNVNVEGTCLSSDIECLCAMPRLKAIAWAPMLNACVYVNTECQIPFANVRRNSSMSALDVNADCHCGMPTLDPSTKCHWWSLVLNVNIERKGEFLMGSVNDECQCWVSMWSATSVECQCRLSTLSVNLAHWPQMQMWNADIKWTCRMLSLIVTVECQC